MKAAIILRSGESPRCAEFPEPVASDNEVIIRVRAASLKPVDKQLAAGSHYASPRQFPFICGTDGVGYLDGRRVFFGGCRAPYGAMAERTVVPKAFTFPVPDALSDELAAALPNPGISAYLTLTYRAKLAAGENVLVLGATGVTGKLAVKIAKLLGAARVVAAGRNQEALNALAQLGADATIQLNQPPNDLRNAFVREAGTSGFQVVVDYVWGKPTETFLSAITNQAFAEIGTETRLLQVGESAGAAISLPAAVLRSTALTILGTGGIPGRQALTDAFRQVMDYAAKGELRIHTIGIPLSDISGAWEQEQSGRRIVMIP